MTPAISLDDILAKLQGLPPAERKEVVRLARAATKDMVWVPNPGPQTAAYNSAADQLLYGGEAGGGKTDLMVGKAIQRHSRSLLLRRVNKDVSWLVDRMAQVMGGRVGYNGQDNRWTLPGGRVVDFAGCQHPGDEQRSKGRPKDLIAFDEAADFLESQVEFILGWLRTTQPEQACQALFATNPPTSAEGEWLVRWFAPWVDPSHPLYPQPMGGLLWTCRGREDEWLWFTEPGPQLVDGVEKQTISRTFIRSGLGDNPDLARTNYATQLSMLPEELRRRYERGDFTTSASDHEFQVIPTEWIRLAQERWKPNDGRRMEAIGVDVAQGGNDSTVLAPRWTGNSVEIWFDELTVAKGIDTKDGPAVAGRILTRVRDAAQINIDLGGGWGGSARDHLVGADIAVLGVVPSEAASGRTADGMLGFLNKRAEITWRMREMLDPTAKQRVALPPDPQLRADLSSYRWKLITGGRIQIEMKEDIKVRLGRSPDRGDAVILAGSSGSSRVLPRRNDPVYMPASAHMTRQPMSSRRYA